MGELAVLLQQISALLARTCYERRSMKGPISPPRSRGKFATPHLPIAGTRCA
jgi:hypothetical protein